MYPPSSASHRAIGNRASVVPYVRTYYRSSGTLDVSFSCASSAGVFLRPLDDAHHPQSESKLGQKLERRIFCILTKICRQSAVELSNQCMAISHKDRTRESNQCPTNSIAAPWPCSSQSYVVENLFTTCQCRPPPARRERSQQEGARPA